LLLDTIITNMLKINIQGLEDILDPFYRYTRDVVIVVQEKTMTSIENLDKISKDLGCSEDILLNFIKRKMVVF